MSTHGLFARRVGAVLRSDAAWNPCMVVLFSMAVALGRMSIPSGGSMAVVWPAAGVGLVWMLRFALRGWRGSATGMILLFSALVLQNIVRGTPLSMSLMYGLANLVLAVVAAAVYARGPGRRLESQTHFFWLLMAGVVGSLASAPFGAGGTILLLSAPLEHVVQWVLRNTVSILFVGIVVLRLMSRGPRVLRLPSRVVLASGTALTLVTYGFIFYSDDPVWLFLLVPVSMYVALRADVRSTAWHTVTVAVFAITVTVWGLGPLGDEPPTQRGVIVQGIVIVLSVVAMTLVLHREEQGRLAATIDAHRLASAGHAELLERLVGSLRDGVILVASDGAVTMRNANAGAMLARLGAKGGMVPATLYDPQFNDLRVLNKVFLGGEEVTQDVPVRVGEDCVAVYSLTARSLSLSEETQAVVVLRDVTEERRRTEELSRFAGVVAHDLRNPLSAIRAWVEVLQDEFEDDPTHRQMLERIAGSGRRMNQLIEDLLAYSVVRGGDIEPQPLSLQRICEEVAEAQRVRLDLPQPPIVLVAAPWWVVADAASLRQVLTNLVGNAVKYTGPGRRPWVQISSRLTDDGRVEIEVADRGIGLPPGEEALVFNEFHRVPEHAGAYSGTGLGLAICRRIVERHGGRIWATARPGGGTSVRFTLPAYEPSRHDAAEQAATAQGQVAASLSTASVAPPALEQRDIRRPSSA